MARAEKASVSEYVLYQALEAGDAEEVAMLLQAGLGASAYAPDGDSPLLCAVKQAQPDMVRLLLEHGASPSDKDLSGHTALHLAAVIPSSAAAKVLADLMAFGADTEARTPEGMTPLMLALEGNHKQAIEALFDDAHLMVCDSWGRTPLHLAVSAGSSKLVERLLALGHSPNATDESGRSALHYSAVRGIKAATQVLLKAGANVHLKDSQGLTAQQLAAHEGNTKVEELLSQTAISDESTPTRLDQHQGPASRVLSPSNPLIMPVASDISDHNAANGADDMPEQPDAFSPRTHTIAERQSLQARLQELEGVEDQRGALEARLWHMSNQHTAAITTVQDENAQLQAAKVSMEDQVEVHKAELQQLTDEMGKLREESALLQGARASAEKTSAEMQLMASELQIIGQEKAHLQACLQAAEEQRTRHHELQAFVEHQQQDLDAIIAQKNALSMSLHQAHETARQHTSDLQKLAQEKASLTSMLHAAEQKLHEQSAAFEQFAKQRQQECRELAVENDKISGVLAEHQERARGQSVAHAAELARLQARNQSLASHAKVLENAVQRKPCSPIPSSRTGVELQEAIAAALSSLSQILQDKTAATLPSTPQLQLLKDIAATQQHHAASNSRDHAGAQPDSTPTEPSPTPGGASNLGCLERQVAGVRTQPAFSARTHSGMPVASMKTAPAAERHSSAEVAADLRSFMHARPADQGSPADVAIGVLKPAHAEENPADIRTGAGTPGQKATPGCKRRSILGNIGNLLGVGIENMA